MKIDTYVEARFACSVHLDTVRPDDGFAFAPFLQFVGERYHFQTVGLSETSQLPAFSAGEFHSNVGLIAITSLELMPNGFMIVGTKTENCEAFFLDLQKSIADEFGFKESYPFKKLYRSTLISDHSTNFDETFGRWIELQSFASSLLEEDDSSVSWHPTSFKISAFRRNVPVQEKQFIFERRIGSGSNTLFSLASATTANHIKILEKLDEVFSARGSSK